jgi:phosphopantetheine adenylyltransferase
MYLHRGHIEISNMQNHLGSKLYVGIDSDEK